MELELVIVGLLCLAVGAFVVCAYWLIDYLDYVRQRRQWFLDHPEDAKERRKRVL